MSGPETPAASISIAEVTRILTASGAPFEMVAQTIRGQRLRVWKHAPGTLRDVFVPSRAFGARDFIVYEDERISFDAHHRAVAAAAHLLTDGLGVAKGDRVAIAMRNLPEWPVAFWATVLVGAISVPLNGWWTGPELEYGLADSGASVLFCDEERLARLAPHLPALKLKAVIVVRAKGAVPPGTARWEDVVAPAAVEDAPLPDVPLDPEDDATIFYTSGTTGKPKGALGTHRNMAGNFYSRLFGGARVELRSGIRPAILEGPAPTPPSALLMSVPFFHATGCHSVLLSSTAAGRTMVLMHRWNAERALELIERERIATFGGVPAMVWQVLESPDFGRRDLSSVRSVFYGGAPAAPELVQRVREAFPLSSLTNGYGLTETSAVTSMNGGADYRRKPDSVGMPVAVVDLRVVGDDGSDVPPGTVGELWIRGPNVVKGYWNKPEATGEAITDGWLHSGDLARIDDEGFVYIVDRAKDMVIRGGENVYSIEVEDALYSHPAVMDAAVIGLPHRVLGEEVGAVVQLRPDTAATEQELKDHVAARIAAFKVPVRIAFRDAPLPRNANGKILKRVLRDEVLAGASDPA